MADPRRMLSQTLYDVNYWKHRCHPPSFSAHRAETGYGGLPLIPGDNSVRHLNRRDEPLRPCGGPERLRPGRGEVARSRAIAPEGLRSHGVGGVSGRDAAIISMAHAHRLSRTLLLNNALTIA